MRKTFSSHEWLGRGGGSRTLMLLIIIGFSFAIWCIYMFSICQLKTRNGHKIKPLPRLLSVKTFTSLTSIPLTFFMRAI